MKMDFMLLAVAFSLQGAFNGEQNKSSQLLQSLGFSSDDLAKIESGELTLDDAKKTYITGFENSVRGRIEKEVEDRKKSEIFNAVHSKNEKLVCEKLGLNYEDYKETEARGRVERILEDAAEKYQQQIETVKNQFKGIDQDKLKEVEKQYQARLTESANQYEGKLSEIQKQLDSVLNEKQNIVVENYKTSVRNKFLQGIENAAFDVSVMEKILEFETQKFGIEIDEVNGQKVAFLTKNGVRAAHPQRPNENLTYKSYLEIVAEENKFVKLSNGGSSGEFELTKEQKETLSNKGISEKALAEREAHLAKLQKK